MEISGKVINVMDLLTGVGKTGNAWKKQEFVIETSDQYPKKVFFHLWGDKVDNNPLNIGDTISVSFDVESREFNGRWYTDLKAWKIVSGNAAKSTGTSASSNEEFANSNPVDETAGDDLPF